MTEEITTQSWLSRIKDALIGILAGFVLIGLAIYGIFWNENHSLHTSKSLKEVQSQLVHVPISPIDANNNLRAVYFSGLATTNDKLEDEDLGLQLTAIALIRKAEMYQWKENVQTETEKQLGGSEKTVKTYSYERIWSDHLINSSQFKELSTHKNPNTMPIESHKEVANNVTIGDFSLSEDLIQRITISTPVDLSTLDLKKLSADYNKPVQLIKNQLYMGADAANSQLGDLRITVSAVLPQTVSIIGEQAGTGIQEFMAPSGQRVLLLASGAHTSDEMFDDAQNQNAMMTWLIRLATLVMLIASLGLIMRPLVVLTDILPIAGTIVGFGTGVIAVVIGLCLWLIFTSMAWFSSRPLISIVILVVAGTIIYFFIKHRATKTL